MTTDEQALKYVKELKEYCAMHLSGCGDDDCALRRVCDYDTCIADLNEVEEEN